MDKDTTQYEDTLKQLNNTQNQINSIMNATKATATALDGSYNALTFRMSQLREQWKATNDEAERESLGKQINEINDKLKSLDASTGNFQRNVGNYAGAFTDAMGTMGGSCNGLVSGLNSIRKGMDLLKAHPLIAIIAVAVTVLMKIADAFKKNEETLNKVTLAFAPLKAVATIATNILDKIASVIADTIAKLGDLSKWIEKVGKKFAKFLRGLGWNDFADSLENSFNKLAEVTAEEERLIKKEQALAKRKREVLISNAQMEMEASEAHAKAADKEHLTIQERQKQLEIYASKQKQIAANNLEIAKTELEIAQGRAAQAPNDAAANDALAQAQAKVYQQQIAYNNTIRSINSERAALMKQDATLQVNINKQEAKELQISIKQEQDAIKEKLKGLKDSYTQRESLVKDYINKEKLLLLQRLQNAEITQEEYNKALRQIEVNANIQRLEQATAFMQELKGIEDENITSTGEYASLMSDTLGNITAATEEQIESQKALIDEQAQAIVATLDIAQQTFSELASIGDGVSSQWANSIGRVSQLVTTVSDTLKNGEKGWKSYGKIASASLNLVSSVLGALADEQDTSTREGFEKQKKLQIGQATMSMLSGIIAAWTSAMALPAPASFIIGAIETAATAALGGVQIAQIAKQKFDGGGSSGSTSATSATPSSSAISTLNVPVQYTQDVQGASIEESIGNQKVYVTEGDIKDVSNKVNVAESEAKF